MADMISIIRKRACYPLEWNGDTIYLRGLKDSELEAVAPISEQPESIGYAIGKTLVNADGTPEFDQEEKETPAEFGKRVLNVLDMSGDLKAFLISSISKIGSGNTDFDKLKKN